MRRAAAGLAFVAFCGCGAAFAEEPGWPAYGGDQGGQRYSQAAEITPANAASLTLAWSYSTRDLKTKGAAIKGSSFENTSILDEGRLYLCSPFDEVSALDPGTGRELWRFDPKIDSSVRYPNSFVCRGVTFWRNPKAAANSECAARIFVATNDRRLIALDAKSGRVCSSFGDKGTAEMLPSPKMTRPTEVQITSAPVVARGVVIVGSSIGDNQRLGAPRGTVFAFDAVTGKPRWTFDPIPRTDTQPNSSSWSAAGAAATGAANVWAPMSVDEQRGLVFLPTTSPSPDFFGGMRPGNDRYADSVVAVRAETGQVAWAFQITHHDVWDYDVPAQPTLANVTYRGKTLPAVIQATKQGLVFTLERDSGTPFIPVEERPVPQAHVPGEQLSPTQPFPIAPKPLAPTRIRPDDAWGLTFWDRGKCRKQIADAWNLGIYTAPSTRGTILYPFTAGGTNWGGLAFDPKHDTVYVNTSSLMHLVTLIPRAKYAAAKAAEPNIEISPDAGTPYGMRRAVMLSPWGLPCNPPPWGMLHAIDMHDGHVKWEVPLGTTEDMAPFTEYFLGNIGVPNLGGPIVTAGGVVFIAATMDDYLRAFDAATGKELWKGRLPAGGQATPMTYVWQGRQYVVIAAGGHDKLGTKRGDMLMAFALPK